MGTNFYLRGHAESDDPAHHIGKRSAAGWYCWVCRTTLCPTGEAGIHEINGAWPDICPKCSTKVKTSCCSFTWAMRPELLDSAIAENVAPRCPACDQPFDDPERYIEDEYGDTYTQKDWAAVLKGCPAIFMDSIGKRFS